VAKKKTEEQPKEYTRRQLSHAKKQKRRQNIIIIGGIVVIAAVILIPIIGWFVAEFLPMRATVLEVNGVRFNMAYYIDVMKIGRMNDSTKDAGTLASEALQYMFQGEVMKQGAAKLGITVSENETKSYLEMMGFPETKGFKGYYEVQIILAKVQNEHFVSQVPAQATQVHALMMMLENDSLAADIRSRIASGDNFTSFAEKYAQNYYSQKVNQGDFGWHIREVLKSQVGTDFPLDYAFSAPAGSLSQPITDNETYKQWGYWLIKVVDKPEEGKANVQALFVSDNVVATDIRAKLEANTAGLGDLAEKYSQYSLSKEKKGDLGLIDEADSTFTDIFHDYVFNQATPTGKWSAPIPETLLWTRGGSWLVKIEGREDNKKVSDEDRNYLVSEAFNKWFTDLTNDPDLKVDTEMMTDKMRQFALERIDK
jgi:parvulin-like peptidyl-prolyl isomerase